MCDCNKTIVPFHCDAGVCVFLSAVGDSRARVLLASQGADPDRLAGALTRLDFRATLSSLDPQPVPSGVGVATYLRHSRQVGGSLEIFLVFVLFFK
jgi:hypothetical protein